MKYIVAYPPVDFRVPFTELDESDIDIYFHYDNSIGKGACEAACAHCYFRNQPTFQIPHEKALSITQSLRAQGYSIGMAPADSFSDDALAAGELAGSAFRLKSIGASAWSSGMPLARDGWRERLARAYEIGFRSIIITAHDVAGNEVPLTGVTKGKNIARAIENINSWNRENPDRQFVSSLTFTIGTHNLDVNLMRTMVEWGVDHQVGLVRFNCFANFGERDEHRHLEMTRPDIERFYMMLRQLQEEFLDTPTSLGISEDWGDAGIEAIYDYLPDVWRSREKGWCRAGYRLFALISVEDRLRLVGCVDKWEPVMGTVEEVEAGVWGIDWNHEAIETLRQATLNEEIYACWGGVGYNRDDAAEFGSDHGREAAIMAHASESYRESRDRRPLPVIPS